MPAEVFFKLRDRLDQYSVGFPSTASGVEIKLLEKLFTEEEARMYLNLGQKLETPEELAYRTDQDPGMVSDILEGMVEKGLLFRSMKNEVKRYAAAAFFYGIFEYQEKTMDRELAELLNGYFEEAFLHKMSEQTLITRTVPVSRSVDVGRIVSPYDDGRALIKSQPQVAVANCVCRVHQGHLDQGCDKPIEVCFYFGANGQFFVDRDMARWVSQEEALEIHARCEAAGLVSQPDNTQKPIVMCHCCGDCCVPLKAIKKQPRPVEAVVSSYFAAVDSELCDGCETCLDRCQMEAIAIEEETAVVNTDRCIGCGLCVTTCPTEALALELKPEDMRPREPLKPHEAMMRVAQKRGKSLPTMH